MDYNHDEGKKERERGRECNGRRTMVGWNHRSLDLAFVVLVVFGVFV